jgi:hypothetical protein
VEPNRDLGQMVILKLLTTNMKNKNLNLIIIGFLAIFFVQFVSAYKAPTANPNGDNTVTPMDNSTTENKKYAGLGVKAFSSGNTGLVVINQSGNVGVNTSSAPSDVRMNVNGSVKFKTFAGTGERRLCGSTVGSSTDGYPLVICP